MSTVNEKRFDFWFKVLVSLAILFFSWLGGRTAAQFDVVISDVQELKSSTREIKKDIEWLKIDRQSNSK